MSLQQINCKNSDSFMNSDASHVVTVVNELIDLTSVE